MDAGEASRLDDVRPGPVEYGAMLRPSFQSTNRPICWIFRDGSIPTGTTYFRAHFRQPKNRTTMWQRKQSLFLLVASLLCLGTWSFPVTTYQRADGDFTLRTTGLYNAEGVEVPDVEIKLPFYIVLTVLGVALLVTVFLFGDRRRQMRFVRGTYLLLLGIIAFLFITDNSVQAYLEQGGTVISHYGPSFFFPLVALILAVLAERSIKADDELVRSADRLR